jgi:hypothetical protein
MRGFWSKTPWWLSILIWPPCIALAMTICWHEAPLPPRPGWTFSVIVGVLCGVVGGAPLGWWFAKRERKDREILRLLATKDRAVALRAAVRGPIPVDPEIRRVVRRLVDHRLGGQKNKRMHWDEYGMPWLSLAFLLDRDEIAWHWRLLFATIYVYLVIHRMIKNRRLRKRSQALQDKKEDKGEQVVGTHLDAQTCR